MDDDPRAGLRLRDEPSHSYDLSDAVYGMFPSRAPDTSIRRSRAGSPTKSACKQKDPSPSIKLARSAATPVWFSQDNRARLQTHQMELHQSTCLNLGLAAENNSESDLWILPDFDDWELDTETRQQTTAKQESDWAPLLRRAASSNRERLRARLEGDGWDFVGGKYGEDEKMLRDVATQRQESVDDEFDVVVLPAVQISC